MRQIIPGLQSAPSPRPAAEAPALKLDATALYAKVATRTLHAVTGPRDQLIALMDGKAPAG